VLRRRIFTTSILAAAAVFFFATQSRPQHLKTMREEGLADTLLLVHQPPPSWLSAWLDRRHHRRWAGMRTVIMRKSGAATVVVVQTANDIALISTKLICDSKTRKAE